MCIVALYLNQLLRSGDTILHLAMWGPFNESPGVGGSLRANIDLENGLWILIYYMTQLYKEPVFHSALEVGRCVVICVQVKQLSL